MSTADLLGTAGRPVGDKPDLEKKLFRIAGLGAVGALVAWVGQPIMVTLAAQREGGGEVTDWAGVESAKWSGAVEVVVFSGMGLGMLFFVLATWQLLRLRLGGSSIAAQAGMTGGVLGAVAWFLTAAESFRMYTSIGAGIPDAVPDSNLQKAVIGRHRARHHRNTHPVPGGLHGLADLAGDCRPEGSRDRAPAHCADRVVVSGGDRPAGGAVLASLATGGLPARDAGDWHFLPDQVAPVTGLRHG